jgi:hypothetical protein
MGRQAYTYDRVETLRAVLSVHRLSWRWRGESYAEVEISTSSRDTRR